MTNRRDCTGRTLGATLVAISVCGTSCEERQSLPPVISTGKYVRYATNARASDVCGGTVAELDQFVEDLGLALGVDLPEEPFITYYWLPHDLVDLAPCDGQPSIGANCARRDGGTSVVYAADARNLHEMVHAVHFQALPGGAAFLHEGLAQVYGDQLVDRAELTPDDDLDQVLVGEGNATDFYAVSWHLVYWMLRRHGTDEFRDFWSQLGEPTETTAQDVRDVFETVFGETLELQITETADAPACTIPQCGSDPKLWSGDTWSARAPTSCSDADALGPGTDTESPIVLSRTILEITESADYVVVFDGAEADDSADLRRCDDVCTGAPDSISFRAGGDAETLRLDGGRWVATVANRSGTTPAELRIGPAQ